MKWTLNPLMLLSCPFYLLLVYVVSTSYIVSTFLYTIQDTISSSHSSDLILLKGIAEATACLVFSQHLPLPVCICYTFRIS